MLSATFLGHVASSRYFCSLSNFSSSFVSAWMMSAGLNHLNASSSFDWHFSSVATPYRFRFRRYSGSSAPLKAGLSLPPLFFAGEIDSSPFTAPSPRGVHFTSTHHTAPLGVAPGAAPFTHLLPTQNFDLIDFAYADTFASMSLWLTCRTLSTDISTCWLISP